MSTRHSSYKWNRLCEALERATEPLETYEEVKARLAVEKLAYENYLAHCAYMNDGIMDEDERPLPFDKMSDYSPEERGNDERNSN